MSSTNKQNNGLNVSTRFIKCTDRIKNSLMICSFDIALDKHVTKCACIQYGRQF